MVKIQPNLSQSLSVYKYSDYYIWWFISSKKETHIQNWLEHYTDTVENKVKIAPSHN